MSDRIWTVLEHERGGMEVWDCDEFGPWHRKAGPFATRQEAIRTYQDLTGQTGDGGITLVMPPDGSRR